MTRLCSTLALLACCTHAAMAQTSVDITACSTPPCNPNGAALSADSSPVVDALDNASTLPISISTATTTQLIPAVAGQPIYVTGGRIVIPSPNTITLEYGAGTNCGTGTHALTGPMNLVASGGPLSLDGGFGSASLIVPAGNALCVVTSSAIQTSGWVTFAR